VVGIYTATSVVAVQRLSPVERIIVIIIIIIKRLMLERFLLVDMVSTASNSVAGMRGRLPMHHHHVSAQQQSSTIIIIIIIIVYRGEGPGNRFETFDVW